jgi:hypothetical protein
LQKLLLNIKNETYNLELKNKWKDSFIGKRIKLLWRLDIYSTIVYCHSFIAIFFIIMTKPYNMCLLIFRAIHPSSLSYFYIPMIILLSSKRDKPRKKNIL